jgi:hypothetical protein
MFFPVNKKVRVCPSHHNYSSFSNLDVLVLTLNEEQSIILTTQHENFSVEHQQKAPFIN